MSGVLGQRPPFEFRPTGVRNLEGMTDLDDMTATHERPYDIVLFGATGFVGKLAAQQLAKAENDDLVIALAGRNTSKLDDVAAQFPRTPGWELVVTDASSSEQVDQLARRSRVVITTVGPFARYGMPLAEACAAAGTHYVDLTGEVLYHHDVIDRCDAAARESGARIVPSCGYDSVPSDLAVFELARVASENGDGTLTATTTYASMKGGMSGGTIASAMQQADDVAADPERRKIATDKFALSPDRAAEPSGEFKDSMSVWHSDDLDAWVAPFIMASYNTRVVRRSNALLGHAYGDGFRYREVMKVGSGNAGRVKANVARAAVAGGFAALGLKPARPLVQKLVPQPGTGPDQKSRDAGFFRMDVRTTTTSGAKYRSIVSAQGDPGYNATAVMLTQAALTLAHDDLPKLPGGADGGVLTPAVALGQPYITRLRNHGFDIKAERL